MNKMKLFLIILASSAQGSPTNHLMFCKLSNTCARKIFCNDHRKSAILSFSPSGGGATFCNENQIWILEPQLPGKNWYIIQTYAVYMYIMLHLHTCIPKWHIYITHILLSLPLCFFSLSLSLSLSVFFSLFNISIYLSIYPSIIVCTESGIRCVVSL